MKNLKVISVFLFTLFRLNSGICQYVLISDQVWSPINLNVDTFRNGDSIPEAKTNEEWIYAAENGLPAWCYYDNDLMNGRKYGKLYNTFAVIDPRGLAPEGWHIPTSEEWDQLVAYLGGEEVAGKKMKSSVGWTENGDGTNESGFCAVPGGARFQDGTFEQLGELGYWCMASLDPDDFGWTKYISFRKKYCLDFGGSDGDGFSVRLIKD